MKALILAAGLGSRLKHETLHLPKALVNVNGKPILSYQIEALIENGIDELIVVLGKESEKIVEFFSTNYSDLKVQFVKNPDYDKTNSSYSFWLAKDYLIGEEYIHINCDIIFSQRLLKRLLTNKNPNLIAVRTDLEITDEMENVVLKGERIIKMRKKWANDSVGKAFGLAKFDYESTKRIIDKIDGYIIKGDFNQHCYGIIRELTSEIEYYALIANDDLLLEINSLKDLTHAEKMLNSYS